MCDSKMILQIFSLFLCAMCVCDVTRFYFHLLYDSDISRATHDEIAKEENEFAHQKSISFVVPYCRIRSWTQAQS